MASDDWKKRIRAEQLAKMERGATLGEEMDRLYSYHFNELEKEIRVFEQRYADKNGLSLAEVKARVDDFDVKSFEEKAKRYVAEKNFSARANSELALYNLKMKTNRLALLQYQLDLELVALAEDERQLTERFLNDEFVKAIETQSGLLGRSVLSASQIGTTAQAILNTPFHGANWSDNIWKRQTALREVVARMTERLLLQGKNPTTMVAQLRKEFNVTASEAKRLAVTEGARVATEGQKQAYIANGYDEYEFIAEPSACRDCAKLDGKIFKVKDMEPGENAAPMHPWCHCSTGAYVDDKAGGSTLDEYELWNSNTLEKDKEKAYNQGMKNSGAIYGAWNAKNDPDEIHRKKHAELYYESVRNRSTVHEVARIAKHTGFAERDVQAIYDHVFENYYELEGGSKRFDPDYDMAQSWDRLFSGKDIQKHDITLLHHELMESKLMAEGMNYDTAHKITQKKYDYLSELIKWQIERGDL
ncbi:TPA: minor capsid protein [Streptococcus suis]|nr:minor capsid protein [Streptococcus suis]